MKKQLILTKINKNYILTEENCEKNSIKIANKVINGEDIYNKFYKNITEEIQYSIKDETLDANSKIIYSQLCDLFKKIDDSVNKKCFSKGE